MTREPISFRRPALKHRAVPAILAVAVLAKLAVASTTGLAKDEGYYTLWSLHPAFGYLDHPPLVAWFIAAGRALLGDSTIGIRLLAILSSLLTTAALFRTGVLLFDRGTAKLAVLWYVLTVAIGLDFLITPDTPSVLFWTLCIWALAEFIDSEGPGWWLLLGVFAGLGVESKYTNLFLGLGLLLLAVSARGGRRWFRLWQLWAGGALAVLLALPNLIWNSRHGWVTVLFQGGRLADTLTSGNFWELLAAQAVLLGPGIVVFALCGAALGVLRARGPTNGFAVLGLTVLPVWLYFLVHALSARVEANWLLPAVPSLVLLSAAGAKKLASGRVGGLVRFGIIVQTVYGAAALLVVYAQIIAQPWSLPELDRTRELRGWGELQAEVSGLAKVNGATWVATLGDYGLTGQLVTYGRLAGDPLPVQPLGEPVRYAFLPPQPSAVLQQPALFVAAVFAAETPEPPPSLFSARQFLTFISRRHGEDIIEKYAVYKVAGLDPAFLVAPGGPKAASAAPGGAP